MKCDDNQPVVATAVVDSGNPEELWSSANIKLIRFIIGHIHINIQIQRRDADQEKKFQQ
jgi:hypothetical protein